ncbi:RAD50-interacting protein 1-like [Choristoneura fumiferana]|uniref:RAD50-interacting protein 1-like n=2 Tax=Choristoneura fumiferana TaxID=7141 RepID=UPI003D1567F6
MVTGADNSPLPKDVLVKFYGLTKFLFLIEEPDDEQARMLSGDFSLENPCLPVKILLRPLKKRFTFHFTGQRQTARLDRPEWFLTQTLTWIKDHQGFVKSHVQPLADKLNIRHIRAVAEFNAGLISFAAERLHTVLGLYNTQGTKHENIADTDAAFAHAVDEALGFHRELVLMTGHEANSVLSVLTKAEIFVRWLAVEKKYALAKLDETLDNEQWSEPIAGGNGSAVGTVIWVPRGADWFIALLKTIEDRYAVLPQPGHRLQFLELQLELVEEWRVRLTQIMSAALGALEADSFLAGGARDPLSAVVNAAHYSREVLLQWAHSLHYLQLHYYRRQFQHFTHQQHQEDSESLGSDDENDDDKRGKEKSDSEDEALSLKDVEQKAKNLALDELTRRNSAMPELSQFDIMSPTGTRNVPELTSQAAEEAGVWAEAPGLLGRLRDAGLKALVDHAFMEFKAAMREYRRQKWHAMLVVEENALCVSGPLCRPLSALCARLATASARLAPALSVRLRGCLAENVDGYIFEEVVLESWFNTGGTMQFTHDVKRNLVPAFAPPNKSASQINYLPKLLESCKLLNMEYDDARCLRAQVKKPSIAAKETLLNQGIRVIEPPEALRILNQRTDLSDAGAGSVMDLF